MAFRYFELFPPFPPNEYEDNGKSLKTPKFNESLWPYFVDRSESISKIFLFPHKGGKINRNKINKLSEIINVSPEGFLQLNSLNLLDKRTISEVKVLIEAHGYFNIFFYTEDFDFISGLCRLFPFPGKFVEKEKIADKNEDNERLGQFIDSIFPKGFLITFFNEGNFIAIWGNEESLNSTIEHY